MFMRESPGVYEFGTRRVFVKSNDRELLVKVGGTFINIDEFLNQAMSEELAKLENREPFKQISSSNNCNLSAFSAKHQVTTNYKL